MTGNFTLTIGDILCGSGSGVFWTFVGIGEIAVVAWWTWIALLIGGRAGESEMFALGDLGEVCTGGRVRLVFASFFAIEIRQQ